MTDDKLTKLVRKVLGDKKTPPNWNASRLDLSLKDLSEEYNGRLADSVVRRSVQFKREYGTSGDADFQVLLDFFYVREDVLSKLWPKREVQDEEIQRKIYGALTDVCAVIALTPTGVRVGDHWINMYQLFKAAQKRKKATH